ncbi:MULTISPECIES: hypothetical protein [Clostridium]|uniref:hypothetical protein n=1 Tax=Clostridium TaxID=1485 RepID=UPI0014940907|nr:MULTISPECIES: hypothetical protein [Clostridium]NOW92384.1 hypothetical protein [Clostridium beijerinckii]
MKKNLVKTLSLLLVTSSLFALPVFAAEKPSGIQSTNSIITPDAMVSYKISQTKRYSSDNYPSKIWYSGYYAGSNVSGYLYFTSAYQSDGYWIVTYTGNVTGQA